MGFRWIFDGFCLTYELQINLSPLVGGADDTAKYRISQKPSILTAGDNARDTPTNPVAPHIIVFFPMVKKQVFRAPGPPPLRKLVFPL